MKAISAAVKRRMSLVRGERGFTLVEVVLALGLFVIVAGSVAGLLSGAIAAHKVARERTIAEEQATEYIEEIRLKPYNDVGTPSGNPPGTVPATKNIDLPGLKATAGVKITYVSDPTPTSYGAAHYKKVLLTLTRDRDGHVLTSQVTFIAPPGRAAYGGINQAVVKAQVQDMGLLAGVPNIVVNLQTGPSAPRFDITDADGNVMFAGLTANPDENSFYDLVLPQTPAGFEKLSDTVPPNPGARQSLAPAEEWPAVLKIFRPSTIYVHVNNPDGTPYTAANASLRISSSLNKAETFTVPPSSPRPYAVSAVQGDKIAPADYTVSAKTPTPLCADLSPRSVPDDYGAGVYTTTITAILGPCPSADLVVRVRRGFVSIGGATVHVTGGPNNVSVIGTTSTNATDLGRVTFTLPTGSGYTVKAYKCTPADGTNPNPRVSLNVATSVPPSTSPLTVTLTRDSPPCP